MSSDKAKKYINTWEEIDRDHEIYQRVNEFNEKHESKDEKIKELRKLVEKAYLKKDADDCLMWLSEYQLYAGIDDFSVKYEEWIGVNFTKNSQNMDFRIFPRNEYNTDKKFVIEDYKDKFKGQRCFIIGNGPSLNKIDLTLLKDEITFGVNAIFLNKDKMGFLPTFYVVEDSHVGRERKDEVNALEDSCKIFGYYFNSTLANTPNTKWVNIVPYYSPYENFPHFSVDAGKRVWVGGTVSYINLQLAYYMGFSEVYLIGFDHSYVIPDSAEVKGTDIKSTDNDVNHFHPDYFGKGYKWHVPLTERMELSYIKAKHAFEACGRTVYNATAGGKLEVFERIKYENIFESGMPAQVNGSNGVEWVKDTVSQEYDEIEKANNEKPLASVVIPVYNVEEYVERCISSVLAQTYDNVEILVVIDGSEDDSISIARRMAENNPNIRIIEQKNIGLGGARNTGIREAKGKYLYFLDADDTMNPRSIELLVEKAVLEDSDIVQSNFIKTNNGVEEKHRYDPYTEGGVKGFQKLSLKGPFMATARLYKRSFILKNSLYFALDIYHEDIPFSFNAVSKANKVSYIDYVSYNWLVRENSISRSITKKHIDDFFTIFEMVNLQAMQDFASDDVKNYILIFYYRFCRTLFLRVQNSDKKHKKKLVQHFWDKFKKLQLNDLNKAKKIKDLYNLEYPYMVFSLLREECDSFEVIALKESKEEKKKERANYNITPVPICKRLPLTIAETAKLFVAHSQKIISDSKLGICMGFLTVLLVTLLGVFSTAFKALFLLFASVVFALVLFLFWVSYYNWYVAEVLNEHEKKNVEHLNNLISKINSK